MERNKKGNSLKKKQKEKCFQLCVHGLPDMDLNPWYVK